MKNLIGITLSLISFSACAGSMQTFPPDQYITPSVYYLPVVETANLNCGKDSVVTMRTSNGTEISKMCKTQHQNCAIQGSCYLHDENGYKMINVSKIVSGEMRFHIIKDHQCPFGWGSHSACTDPNYSIAADLSIYPMGTVIYIDVVRGLPLPNGERHSGYFIVRDEGGGIKGPGRFDFFTGLLHPYDPSNSLAKFGLADPDRHFAYKVVPAEIAQQVLALRQYPNLKPSVIEEATRIFGN